MKVTVCQLDNRAGPLEPMLDDLASHIAQEKSAFLLLPEMCFHEWLAADRKPGGKRWMAAVESHAALILQLGRLGARADCGGLGWIISPEGDVMAQTRSAQSIYQPGDRYRIFASQYIRLPSLRGRING